MNWTTAAHYREQDRKEEAERITQAFFAEANPCEACGRPAGERFFDPEHQLWVGADCPCILLHQIPVNFRCPEEYRIVLAGRSLSQISQAVRFHRLICPVCRREVAGQVQPIERRKAA
jgi:hypothetical protein